MIAKNTTKQKFGLAITLVYLLGIFSGEQIQKREFIKRSLDIEEKDSFGNQDIEHILFNTPL